MALKTYIELQSEEIHNTWMKEKLAQGFHAPTNCPHIKPIGESLINPISRKFNNHCKKCHTDLYPYAELPEHIKDYDRVTAMSSVKGLKKLREMNIDLNEVVDSWDTSHAL